MRERMMVVSVGFGWNVRSVLFDITLPHLKSYMPSTLVEIKREQLWLIQISRLAGLYRTEQKEKLKLNLRTKNGHIAMLR